MYKHFLHNEFDQSHWIAVQFCCCGSPGLAFQSPSFHSPLWRLVLTQSFIKWITQKQGEANRVGGTYNFRTVLSPNPHWWRQGPALIFPCSDSSSAAAGSHRTSSRMKVPQACVCVGFLSTYPDWLLMWDQIHSHFTQHRHWLWWHRSNPLTVADSLSALIHQAHVDYSSRLNSFPPVCDKLHHHKRQWSPSNKENWGKERWCDPSHCQWRWSYLLCHK